MSREPHHVQFASVELDARAEGLGADTTYWVSIRQLTVKASRAPTTPGSVLRFPSQGLGHSGPAGPGLDGWTLPGSRRLDPGGLS